MNREDSGKVIEKGFNLNSVTKKIGLIVPAIDYPFFLKLSNCLQNISFPLGFNIILSDSTQVPEVDCINLFLDDNIQGLIVASRQPELYNDITIPIVGIDEPIGPNGYFVSSDNYDGGRLVAEDFIKSRCHKIILLRGPHGIDAFDLRAQGIKDRLKSELIEIHEVEVTYNVEKDRVILEDIFKNNLFDGIFTAYDMLAHLCEGFNDNYLHCNHLKVIGYDGLDINEDIDVKHSTVTQDMDKLAEKLIELLMKQINRETIEHAISLIPVKYYYKKDKE